MLNSYQLFSDRLRQNWKYQYNIFKTIADWTVMLYIIIPSVVIILAIYHSWWNEIPEWIELIPFPLLFASLFLFIWGGHFRTYLRDADRVFLMKNKLLHLGLKQKGIIYTYAFQLLPTVVLGFLIAPFWLNYFQIGIDQFALYLGLFLSSKWLIMGVKSKLTVDLHGWRKVTRSIPLFFAIAVMWLLFYHASQVNHILLMMGLILCNILGSVFLIKKRFISVQTFEQDLAIDELEKSKYITLIFGMSTDIEKPFKPLPSRKSPILYSKSNRLFKKRTPRNGFLELFIKTTTRNSEYILRYLQIIGVNSLAIVLIPPLWFKFIIVIFGFLFVRTWIRDTWDKVVGSHAFTMKYATMEAFFQGRRRVTFVLSLLFLILISFTFLIRVWLATFV